MVRRGSNVRNGSKAATIAWGQPVEVSGDDGRRPSSKHATACELHGRPYSGLRQTSPSTPSMWRLGRQALRSPAVTRTEERLAQSGGGPFPDLVRQSLLRGSPLTQHRPAAAKIATAGLCVNCNCWREPAIRPSRREGQPDMAGGWSFETCLSGYNGTGGIITDFLFNRSRVRTR